MCNTAEDRFNAKDAKDEIRSPLRPLHPLWCITLSVIYTVEVTHSLLAAPLRMSDLYYITIRGLEGTEGFFGGGN